MGKSKVLVVDDELPLAAMVSRVFGLEGYEADTAKDGQDGLEKLSQGYDGIVTDLRMPVLDGVGLIKQSRENGFRGFAYLMSATPDEADNCIKRYGLKQGEFFSSYCNGILEKPFSAASIKAIATRHKP